VWGCLCGCDRCARATILSSSVNKAIAKGERDRTTKLQLPPKEVESPPMSHSLPSIRLFLAPLAVSFFGAAPNRIEFLWSHLSANNAKVKQKKCQRERQTQRGKEKGIKLKCRVANT